MRKWVVWPLAIMAAMLMLAITAAMPSQEQDKRPLQPLLQDYYSGGVTILDVAVPAGIQLVACVDSCATYQTDAVTIAEAGAYTGLVIEPSDRRMIGRDVTFHIVNEHGSIQASQTREFYGVYDLYSLDLTFNEPLPRAPTPTPEPTATPEPTPAPTATPVPPTATPEPTPIPEPTPTAILPVTGDTAVTRIPPLAIVGGIVLVLGGAALLYAAARRVRGARQPEGPAA